MRRCISYGGRSSAAFLGLAAALGRHRCNSTVEVSAMASAPSGASSTVVKSPPTPNENACVAAPPHRTVGGVFFVYCNDHPFKHSWEINQMLRELRFEFRGQVTVHPDIPEVRKRLWRVRHVVLIERIDLDEAKTLVGIPQHMQFSDLAKQIPSTFGRTTGKKNPILRSKMNFMQYRRMRIRDVLHRDALEKRLLEAKRRVATASASSQ